MRIGLISDTHGLLRPEAFDALRGSDRILHAGDIGSPGILDVLAAIAPVTAIRGNNDTADWARDLPDSLTLDVGIAIHLLHDLKTLSRYPPDRAVDVIIAGHSHKPAIERGADGVLRVNPGSAGRRRFTLPITVAQLVIEGRDVQATIIDLGA